MKSNKNITLLKFRTIQNLFWCYTKKRWAVILSFVIWAGLVLNAWSDTRLQGMEPPPFAPGERLSYELRWSFVPAGTAVLEVLPMELIDGEPTYHIRLTIKTNAFVDLFYKVREQVDSYVDQKISHSVRYLKDQLQGDTRRNISVVFDWKSGVAYYDNGERQSRIELLPGSFDPLSVFYYVRTLAFKENDLLERVVTDGKTSILGQARIIKRQKVRLPDRSYDTFLMEPSMEHIGGIFEKEKGAKIKLWVTADHRHIPVKIASKVSIGSFVGELVSIEPALTPPSKDM